MVDPSKRLFRQAALDRLSSPERIDELMEVTTRRGWLQRGTPPLRIPRSFIEEFDRATFAAAVRGGLTALRPIDALKDVAARR